MMLSCSVASTHTTEITEERSMRRCTMPKIFAASCSYGKRRIIHTTYIYTSNIQYMVVLCYKWRNGGDRD